MHVAYIHDLTRLETVSSTFLDLDFDGSLYLHNHSITVDATIMVRKIWKNHW